MPGPHGRDGKVEISLWIHDTGEAYRVEIIRWQNGKWVPAPDVHVDLLSKSGAILQQLTQQYPDYIFYWYYLADVFSTTRACIRQLSLNSEGAQAPGSVSFQRGTKKVGKEIKQAMVTSYKPCPGNDIAVISSLRSNYEWDASGYMDSQGHIRLEPVLDDAQESNRMDWLWL